MKFIRVLEILEERDIEYYWTSPNSVVIKDIKKKHKIGITKFENHSSIFYDTVHSGWTAALKNEIDFIKYLDRALKDAGYIKKTHYKQLNLFGDDNI